MLKFGFELEAFVRDTAKQALILVPSGLPFDECGWLAEIRSEPHANILKAIGLLEAETIIVTRQAKVAGAELIYEPLLEVPRALKVAAARRHGKGLVNYRNLYGYETHRNSTKLQTASLHVSVTNEQLLWYTDSNKSQVSKGHQGFIDHARLVMGLDKAFKTEIKNAKRNPGFYEVKRDGRIEYRSLPNNVDLTKLEEVLTKLIPSLT